VPAAARAGLRSPKAILRRAVSDLVPQEVLSAPKRGFPVPVASFLAADPALRDLILSERALDRGLFEPSALHGVVERGRDLELFTLAMLELHLRANVDAVTEAPPSADGVLTAPVEAAHA
jgi:asparagine synthase (glutamine-hydrolysing)